MVNLARNSLRRRRLARRHATVSLEVGCSAEEEAIIAFEPQEIVRGLQELPRRQREVLVLRYFLDCSTEETAQLLGITTGSVKGYASRGIQRLKDEM
ncbi:MAG: sigma-70 family RNA polymerase sigma factor [Kineosporiaceae bacterium]